MSDLIVCPFGAKHAGMPPEFPCGNAGQPHDVDLGLVVRWLARTVAVSGPECTCETDGYCAVCR